MPLDQLAPIIDDRRFDDIVAEARTRIPRYTREWTDFNEGDPGFALVEMFAWMTDLLLYRMGKVPDLCYIKFLELIGIELNPAKPATTEITLPVSASFANPTLNVPARIEVGAQTPDGAAPVVFETDRSFTALRAPLLNVLAYDGFSYTDVTDSNNNPVFLVSGRPAPGFQPLGPLAGPGSALYLGFHAADANFPELDLDLAFFAAETARVGAIAVTDCGLPQAGAPAPAFLDWEYFDGSEWASLSLVRDDTRALVQSGHVVVKTPSKDPNVSMSPTKVGPVATARYWIRARVDSSSYDRPPALYAIRTNTVSATQAQTVIGEILGGSDASPNQTLKLANTPILAGSLDLQVDEGDGPKSWTLVNDFFGYGPNDRVYRLDRTSGEIRFGNGTNGAIPVANPAEATSNIVAAIYQWGGGSAGNVAAASLNTLLTSVTGLDENGVTNLVTAAGGTDEETLQEAEDRAPRALKSQCRAVTEEDFEMLAMQAANIKRAKALPLYHPSFPDVQVPGVVTIIVVPDTDQPNPSPSEATRKAVCAYLNARRLITTELYVIKPTYQLVSVTGSVTAEPDADLRTVYDAIRAALLAYFHPLTGGEDGKGWPFGGTIYYSRLFRQVLAVPGIRSIEYLVIALNGQVQPECANIAIKPDSLLYSTDHDVKVSYA